MGDQTYCARQKNNTRRIPNRDVTSETKILRLEDFVSTGIIEDGFGVNAGLVCERAIATENTRQ